MKNLYSYLEKNKDVSLKEKPWNMMDNLLCSCIAYIPLIENFDFKTFDELCNEVINFEYPSRPEYVSYSDKKIFTILKDSKRYHDMCFLNYVNIIDDNTQFGALTIRIGNKKIIVFKGTDGSMISWIENLRFGYVYPTYTQNLAIDYLRQNVHMFDYDVIVLGHSKGGNLAIISTMELPWYKQLRIKKIYNFDGPGLRPKEHNSKKYQRIVSKIKTIMPDKSFVGTLLCNDNVISIKTNAVMFWVHYPTNWQVVDDNFVPSESTDLSKKLHLMTSECMENVDYDTVQDVLEEIFKVFDARKKEHFGVTLSDIINIVDKMHDIDEKEKDYVLSIIKSMFELSNK